MSPAAHSGTTPSSHAERVSLHRFPNREPQLLQPVPERALDRIVAVPHLLRIGAHHSPELHPSIRAGEYDLRRAPRSRDRCPKHRFGLTLTEWLGLGVESGSQRRLHLITLLA